MDDGIAGRKAQLSTAEQQQQHLVLDVLCSDIVIAMLCFDECLDIWVMHLHAIDGPLRR